ncbi:MAG: fumarylacetoacetate hydrolase family protein [Betaproteobacteria bacterium]
MQASTMPDDLTPLRDALVDARSRRARIAAAGLPSPRSDSDAYAVQDAVAAAFGWFRTRPVCWKVGAAGRDAVPNAAPLPASGVHVSPARFGAETFGRILIEGEVAFRLGDPLAGDIALDDVATASKSVGEIVVTIEVVDPRLADFEAAPPTLRLADQSLHGALVIGSGMRWRGSLLWGNQAAIVRSNGAIARETVGGHPLGDLMFLLPWLARHAASRGLPLAAGDLVTLGTWTGVFEAGAGQTIDVEFPGIGSASARFD